MTHNVHVLGPPDLRAWNKLVPFLSSVVYFSRGTQPTRKAVRKGTTGGPSQNAGVRVGFPNQFEKWASNKNICGKKQPSGRGCLAQESIQISGLFTCSIEGSVIIQSKKKAFWPWHIQLERKNRSEPLPQYSIISHFRVCGMGNLPKTLALAPFLASCYAFRPEARF